MEASAEAFSRRVQPPCVKTDECKDLRLLLRDINRAMKLAMHLSIIFYSLHISILIMCFKIITVVSQPRSNITLRRQRNPANLRPISTTSTGAAEPLSLLLSGFVELSVSCQQSRLHFCFFFFTIHTQHLGLD